jgi:hypothetical protein
MFKQFFEYLKTSSKKETASNEASSSTIDPVKILPPEIIHLIFSFLSPRDLASTAIVNHQWHELEEADYLWESLLKRDGYFVYKKNNPYNVALTKDMKNDKKSYHRQATRDIQVHFKPLIKGDPISITFKRSETVAGLKEKVAPHLTYQFFSLFFQGRQLVDDNAKLKDVGLKSECTVQYAYNYRGD